MRNLFSSGSCWVSRLERKNGRRKPLCRNTLQRGKVWFHTFLVSTFHLEGLAFLHLQQFIFLVFILISMALENQVSGRVTKLDHGNGSEIRQWTELFRSVPISLICGNCTKVIGTFYCMYVHWKKLFQKLFCLADSFVSSGLAQILVTWQLVPVRMQWIFMIWLWVPHWIESAIAKISQVLWSRWTSLQIPHISRYQSLIFQIIEYKTYSWERFCKYSPLTTARFCNEMFGRLLSLGSLW